MTEAKEQRMILAGRYMLDGNSFKQALIRAGYSEQTARCSKANKLSAKRCIELALKDGQQTLPAALRGSARELLQKKLDSALDKPDTVSLTAAARATEIVEKAYGGRDDQHGKTTARDFTARLEWLVQVSRELKRRGLGNEDETGSPSSGAIDVTAISGVGTTSNSDPN